MWGWRPVIARAPPLVMGPMPFHICIGDLDGGADTKLGVVDNAIRGILTGEMGEWEPVQLHTGRCQALHWGGGLPPAAHPKWEAHLDPCLPLCILFQVTVSSWNPDTTLFWDSEVLVLAGLTLMTANYQEHFTYTVFGLNKRGFNLKYFICALWSSIGEKKTTHFSDKTDFFIKEEKSVNPKMVFNEGS